MDGEASHVHVTTTIVKGTLESLDPIYTTNTLYDILDVEVIRWIGHNFIFVEDALLNFHGIFHKYFSFQMLTKKWDVYSFGVVLLYIICGREPNNAKLFGEKLKLTWLLRLWNTHFLPLTSDFAFVVHLLYMLTMMIVRTFIIDHSLFVDMDEIPVKFV